MSVSSKTATESSSVWSSQTIFIMAAVGSAVGLGNLWKFPYIAGENGGGAFVLVYLACVLLVGLPVLMAEISLGRRGAASPPEAMRKLATENGASKIWWLLGFNGILAGVLILSFYTVIAGWAGAYFIDSLKGTFNNINAEQAGLHFDGLISSPLTLLFWHTVIMLATIVVVAKGLKNGIEKAIIYMMPVLLILLLILLGYAMTLSGFGQSVSFLFEPNFSKLTWNAVLIAMGHAFFTLSIGLGTMMVYGSYLSKKHSIVKASIWISFADTLVALIAGMIIFSIVFSNGLEAGSGPGLLFQTLPVAFGQMMGGWFFGTLFFGLVVIAAFSSAISLIEPAISWLIDRWNMTRIKATWLLGGLTWLVGVGSVLSFNDWSEVHLLEGKTIFDTIDFITTNIMLPLGGLFMAIFFGWLLTKKQVQDELNLKKIKLVIFLNVLKYITPIAVSIVFVSNLL